MRKCVKVFSVSYGHIKTVCKILILYDDPVSVDSVVVDYRFLLAAGS